MRNAEDEHKARCPWCNRIVDVVVEYEGYNCHFGYIRQLSHVCSQCGPVARMTKHETPNLLGI
jgi:C4-type Zn-finger protein